MSAIKKFFDEYIITILGVLLILSFFNDCSRDRRIAKIEKDIRSIKDSTYTKVEFNKELKIMGLESEKRMIQATRRQVLDVERQNQIEKEIEKLRD